MILLSLKTSSYTGTTLLFSAAFNDNKKFIQNKYIVKSHNFSSYRFIGVLYEDIGKQVSHPETKTKVGVPWI